MASILGVLHLKALRLTCGPWEWPGPRRALEFLLQPLKILTEV